MASEYQDPTADVTNNWTKSTGTTGWSCIDDAVRKPSTPTVPGDYISTSTAATVQECNLGAPTLGNPAVAGDCIVHVYAAGGTKRSISLTVYEGTTARSATATVAAGAAAAWVDIPLTSLPANWANLRIRATCNSTGSSSASATTIYEAYVEYVTRAVVTTDATVTGSGSVDSDAVVFQVEERASQVLGVGSIDSDATRIGAVFECSAQIVAVGTVDGDATTISGAAPAHEASASITADGAITALQQRVVSRSGATTGAGTITSSQQRVISRSSQATGTGLITSTQHRVLAHSSATTGTGTITSSATAVQPGIQLISAQIAGTGTITSSQRRVVGRASQATGTGLVLSSQRRVVLRSSTTSGVGTVATTAIVAAPGVRLASAQILGVGAIASQGFVLGKAPTVETHPNLGGVYDEALTGGTYRNRLGGTYGNSTGGNVKIAVTGGQVITAITSGDAESHTGGHPAEPSTGGDLALATGGSHDESLTGGEVL